MLGISLTRTRLSTRLGLSIGERLATLANTLSDSTLPIPSVAGAPAAFDNLQSTADDQDARLAQLEAA